MKSFYINKSTRVDFEKQVDQILSEISLMKIEECEKKFLFSQIENIKNHYSMLTSDRASLRFKFNRSVQSDNCKIMIDIDSKKFNFFQKFLSFFSKSKEK